jgi:transposase
MKKFCETFRKTVLEFIEKPSKLTKTERIKKAAKLFKVSIRTIHSWFQIRKERGDLKRKKAVWYPRKINDQELYDYVQKNPDKYLREIASHFKVSVMTVQRRLIKMRISRKKKQNVIEKGTLKKLQNS